VTDMTGMFFDAVAFGQDLCAWTINPSTAASNMFHNTKCNTESDPSNDNACFYCNAA